MLEKSVAYRTIPGRPHSPSAFPIEVSLALFFILVVGVQILLQLFKPYFLFLTRATTEEVVLHLHGRILVGQFFVL